MATTDAPERGSDGTLTHSCGRKFAHAAWYVKHAKSCSGEAPKTEGAIAARERRSAKRPSRTDPPRGTKTPKRERSAVQPDNGDDTQTISEMLVSLRAKRTKIDAAIEALEALA